MFPARAAVYPTTACYDVAPAERLTVGSSRRSLRCSGAARARRLAQDGVKRVAAIVTEYHHNSHADVIVSRLLQTDTLDGKGPRRKLRLVSLYTDQVPANDISRALARTHGFAIAPTVAQALTLGGDRLAVDGVLLVAEFGDYPVSDTGQTIYPKRRLFEQVVGVFRRTGQVVPVFIDKHLADTWTDASWIYETARSLKIPLMAGSSVPLTWRYPPDDVRDDRPLAEILVLSYHTLDGYGFHAVELAQALAERRRGGETGVARVRCLEGQEVWRCLERGEINRDLLDRALSVLSRPPPAGRSLASLVKIPTLFQVTYRDGLSVQILTLNGAVGEWSAAWRYQGDPAVRATLAYTQEARPLMHFTYLLRGIEQMFLTGRPAWPAERTLLSSGVLDRLLISRKDGGRSLDTPELGLSYPSTGAGPSRRPRPRTARLMDLRTGVLQTQPSPN